MRRGGGAREVSESVMTLLVTEAAHHMAATQKKGDEYLMSSLESIGFRTGVGQIERHMHETPHLHYLQEADGGALEAVKLLWKDLWMAVFKQDSLRPTCNKNRRGVYSLRASGFRWLQHVMHLHEGQYAPGMRCVLVKETVVPDAEGAPRAYPAGTRAVIVHVPPAQHTMTPAPVAQVDVSIEGLVATVDTAHLDVDSPPRLNPHALLFIPSGLIRGWLYGLGIVARVEPKFVDPKVNDTAAPPQPPTAARQLHVVFDITTEPGKLS
eukprot:TRINITY_DN15321_c0_g1_i2.p1 TRINITY_DN15321_c0_g1~~TRINITY_DN15321_c0_g1_i2.p1  ORF type:complete len:267 (+),score=82.13 TRINITY_DN15321_c0_g1_i2:53-853(+)